MTRYHVKNGTAYLLLIKDSTASTYLHPSAIPNLPLISCSGREWQRDGKAISSFLTESRSNHKAAICWHQVAYTRDQWLTESIDIVFSWTNYNQTWWTCRQCAFWHYLKQGTLAMAGLILACFFRVGGTKYRLISDGMHLQVSSENIRAQLSSVRKGDRAISTDWISWHETSVQW